MSYWQPSLNYPLALAACSTGASKGRAKLRPAACTLATSKGLSMCAGSKPVRPLAASVQHLELQQIDHLFLWLSNLKERQKGSSQADKWIIDICSWYLLNSCIWLIDPWIIISALFSYPWFATFTGKYSNHMRKLPFLDSFRTLRLEKCSYLAPISLHTAFSWRYTWTFGGK